MNRISPKVLVLMLVAAVIYWRGGSSEAKEGEDARVVKIPAFPRNSSGSKESFPQQHVTCWCVRENVHCTVPQGLIAGSEKIVCNPVGGYDSIDEEHCRFEYDLYNPDTKFAVEVGERWKVDVEYGSAGTDDNWLGRGMPRTQTDLFKLMMRLTPGFGGHLHSMHHSMYSGNRGWRSGNSLFYPDPFKLVLNQVGRLGRIVSGGKMNGPGHRQSGFHQKRSRKGWSNPKSSRGGYGRKSSRFFSFKGIMVCIGLFLLTSKYLGRARDRSNSSSSRRGHGQAAEFSDQIVSDRSAETDQDNVRASGDQNVEVMSSSQRREAYGTPTESVPRGEESTPTLTGDDQPAAVIDGDTRDAQTDQGDGVESAHSETQVEDDQESIQSSPPDEDPEHRLVPRIARFWRRGGFFNLLVFLSVFEIVSVLLRTGKLHDLVLGLSLSVATYKFVETKLSLAVWEAVCPSIETVFACALEKLESSRQWSYSVLGDANERIAQHTEILRDHVHRNQAYASTAARRGQSALASYRQQLSVGLAELDITTIAAALLVIYVVYRALYRFAAWELLKLVGLVAVAYLAYQLIESGSAGDGRVDRSGSNASFNTGYRGVFRRTGGISRHRRRW